MRCRSARRIFKHWNFRLFVAGQGLPVIGTWMRRIATIWLWLIGHSVYRLRVLGRNHVPAQGPALLVCNHVNYLDWLLLLAVQRRPIRFLVWMPPRGWLRHLLRWVGAIPIDSTVGSRDLIVALHTARQSLAQGRAGRVSAGVRKAASDPSSGTIMEPGFLACGSALGLRLVVCRIAGDVHHWLDRLL
jgi:1-acyl-sn-glycerol-3-phosphate acyltransferase